MKRSANPAKTVFLWDIDGTLLLTGGAGQASFDRVFEELYGEKYIWDNIKPDGRTDESIIEELFLKRFKRNPIKKEKREIIKLYNKAMGEEVHKASRFRVMPKAKETLEKLSQDKNIVMGLATGNFEISAKHKLRKAGLLEYFSFGAYGSDSSDRLKITKLALKRAYEHLGCKPKEIYLVGDTIYDVRCGNKIGVKTIAVCTGATTREQLQKAGAAWVIEDLSKFSKIFK